MENDFVFTITFKNFLPIRIFLPSLVQFGRVVVKKKSKSLQKVYTRTDGALLTWKQKSWLKLSFRWEKKQCFEYHDLDLFFSVSNVIFFFLFLPMTLYVKRLFQGIQLYLRNKQLLEHEIHLFSLSNICIEISFFRIIFQQNMLNSYLPFSILCCLNDTHQLELDVFSLNAVNS